ncbi:MAG TPA: hypothetical protein VFS34_04710, partial [Thermoanaerobaculia bacterium]|nr:hypothetical protein [Thermoanaerobaculia bacterium]
MSEPAAEAEAGEHPSTLRLPRLEWIPALLIAASLLPRILLWFRRDFNHDDFAFAWGTWMRSNGARSGVDLYGYGFVFLLAEIARPLFRAFTESFIALDVMRFLVL